MDSFSKFVFVRAGKHTSVHDMHPHSNDLHSIKSIFQLFNLFMNTILDYFHLSFPLKKGMLTEIHGLHGN